MAVEAGADVAALGEVDEAFASLEKDYEQRRRLVHIKVNPRLDPLRSDPTPGQYIYNLSSKGYAAGTYLLRAKLNDGTTHDVHVSVR